LLHPHSYSVLNGGVSKIILHPGWRGWRGYDGYEMQRRCTEALQTARRGMTIHEESHGFANGGSTDIYDQSGYCIRKMTIIHWI
jgi:hypothetical protein